MMPVVCLSRQTGVILADKKGQPVDWEPLLAGITRGKTVIEYGASRNVFCQGRPADSLFLSVDKTQSEPDSGLTRDEARLFQRAEQSIMAARKGTTPGFKAAAEIPISSYGTSPAATERFLQAACCQPYR